MYSMDFDPARRLLSLQFSGLWSKLQVVQHTAAIATRATMLRVRHGRYAVMVDCTAYPVQQAGVIDGFIPLIRLAHARGHGPIAVVVAATLLKLQGERVLAGEPVRVFTDRAAAEAWIAEHRAGVRAAA